MTNIRSRYDPNTWSGFGLFDPDHISPPVRAFPVSLTTSNQKVAAAAIGKIAFASDRDGNFEIYSMDVDGGGQVRLTENPGEDYSPTWSPDGSRLAFVSTRDGNAEVYVMNADGTGQTRLTNNSASDLNPAWKPDGSEIGFVSNRDGNDEIYLMSPDGGTQTNLTQNRADDSSFSFSLDGTMIAFSSSREDAQFEIYLFSMQNGAVARLTSAEGDDINPGWLAGRITFQTNREENEEIYSLDLNGGQNRLTNNSDLDVDPSPSSDGAAVCFATNRDGNLEIYVMSSDGSGPRRLTSNNAADLQPAVQPRVTIPAPAPPGGATLQFTATEYSVGEGQPHATLTVTRTGNIAGVSAVDFVTVNGSASNRTDYIFHGGTLTFNPGEASLGFTVLLIDDGYVEEDEILTVTLRNLTGATLARKTLRR